MRNSGLVLCYGSHGIVSENIRQSYGENCLISGQHRLCGLEIYVCPEGYNAVDAQDNVISTHSVSEFKYKQQ
jgi:hypothetical protein